jgi:hypothetical protein
LYPIKEKRMCVCNYAVLVLSKTMCPLNKFCSLNSATIVMLFASLAKAII